MKDKRESLVNEYFKANSEYNKEINELAGLLAMYELESIVYLLNDRGSNSDYDEEKFLIKKK